LLVQQRLMMGGGDSLLRMLCSRFMVISLELRLRDDVVSCNLMKG
jgi:hypothetical protein